MNRHAIVQNARICKQQIFHGVDFGEWGRLMAVSIARMQMLPIFGPNNYTAPKPISSNMWHSNHRLVLRPIDNACVAHGTRNPSLLVVFPKIENRALNPLGMCGLGESWRGPRRRPD